jgi:PAS domain S-box-containing protein
MLVLIISGLGLAAILVFYQFNRRKGAERTLRESQARFDWLVRHIKDYAIFQLDAEGRVLSWNEGAGQIKGYSEEEVLGRSISIFYPDEENGRGESVYNLKMAAEQGRFESIGRRRRKDGSVFWADVVALAEECVEDMKESGREVQRIGLDVVGVARTVPVDVHLLRNILNNLVSNAIKYSPSGSRVGLTVEFRWSEVRISVSDQGIGIPAEEQVHLFERFFRASNTAGISGTGLGLSIVKRYLDLMDGAIEVTSVPGSGSVFTVILPAMALATH